MPKCRAAFRLRPLALSLALGAVSLVLQVQAAEQCSDTFSFNLPPEPLNTMLLRFAQQTGVSALFPASEYRDLQGNPLTGLYCVEEALQLMLAGLPVKGRINDRGQLVLTRNDTEPSPAIAERPEEDDQAESPGGLLGAVFRRSERSSEAGESAAILEVTEITVSGSRIRRDGMLTPTPVTAFSSGQMRSMNPGNLVESFDQIPQFLNNESPQTQLNFAGAAGASNLNLRGLGTKRTLVLLNGRRVVGSNRLGSVDINLIPRNMIERVEIVTGGASAAYGTDAVAGVTNLMLDTTFEGIELRAQGGQSARHDARNHDVSLRAGTRLGNHARVIAAHETYVREGIDAYPGRDWYQGWGTVVSPQWIEDGTGPRLLRAPQVVSTSYTFGGLVLAPGSSLHRQMFMPDGTLSPFQVSELSEFGVGRGSQSIANGGSGDNIQALTGAQGGLIADHDRQASFFYADYQPSERLTLFLQGVRSRSETEALGNSPVMFGSWAGRIFSDNAFLDDSVRQTMLSEGLESISINRLHTPADIGRGRMNNQNRTDSWTAGLTYRFDQGRLTGWQLDAYLQDGRNRNRIRLRDFVRTDRVFQALDAVTDPVTGQPACRAALMGNPRYQDCVPLNLLGVGNASAQAMDYVLGPDKVITEYLSQRFGEVSLSGPLSMQGLGAGPVITALGASWREDSIDKRVGPASVVALSVPGNDPAQGIQGIPSTFTGHPDVLQFTGTQPFHGRYTIKELFTELHLPLLSNAPLAEQLDANLALRWADFAGSGAIWSWKAGVDWQLYSDLRARATLSRDIRAANLSERFDAQSQGATGDDPALGNINYAFGQIIGGNPEVRPEEADTFTGGLVFQPGWLPGLALSADYYRITVDGVIEQLGVQRIINDCAAGAAELCAQITRDPTTGRITMVRNLFLNVNEMKVSGVDLEASYRRSLNLLGGDESLALRVLGTWLQESSLTSLGAPKFERAGDVGTSGMPRWRWLISGSYTKGAFSAYLQGRYIARGRLNAEYLQGIDIDDNTVEEVWYADANLSWTLPKAFAGSDLQFFFHINNLFDRDPPLAPSFHPFFGAQQVNQALYDVLGRRYTAGFRLRY